MLQLDAEALYAELREGVRNLSLCNFCTPTKC